MKIPLDSSQVVLSASQPWVQASALSAWTSSTEYTSDCHSRLTIPLLPLRYTHCTALQSAPPHCRCKQIPALLRPPSVAVSSSHHRSRRTPLLPRGLLPSPLSTSRPRPSQPSPNAVPLPLRSVCPSDHRRAAVLVSRSRVVVLGCGVERCDVRASDAGQQRRNHRRLVRRVLRSVSAHHPLHSTLSPTPQQRRPSLTASPPLCRCCRLQMVRPLSAPRSDVSCPASSHPLLLS